MFGSHARSEVISYLSLHHFERERIYVGWTLGAGHIYVSWHARSEVIFHTSAAPLGVGDNICWLGHRSKEIFIPVGCTTWRWTIYVSWYLGAQ